MELLKKFLASLFVVCVASLASVCFVGVAYATPSIKDYGSLPQTQMIAVSPNGTLIAFRLVTDASDKLIVASMVDHKPIISADMSDIKPQSIFFFNDDQIYLSASHFTSMEDFKGRFDVSTAYVLDVKTRKVRQLLTPGEVIYPGQKGLGNVVGMTSDGGHVLMPAYVGAIEDVPKLALLKVNLKDNLSPKIVEAGVAEGKNYFVDAQGSPIAMETYSDKKDIHKILSKKNNSWVEIFSEEVPIRSKAFVGLTPDYKSLVMLETDEKNRRVSYFTMSLADGKISGPLYSRADADIEGVVKNMQHVVLGVQYSGFYPAYKFFDEKLERRFAQVAAKFPEQSVWLSSISQDSRLLIVYVEGSNYVGDYYLFEDGKDSVFLTSGRPAIKPEDINPIGRVSFKSRDGLKIPTLLTIPRASADSIKNLPAVILPHGGPEDHDNIEFNWMAQAFASRGYLVVQPQFRGSDGFGLEFNLAGRGQWGKAMQNDLSDATRFFIEKGMVDSKRVCIVGASYGGYAALAGGAFTPELYRCVVSINGIGDLNGLYKFDREQNGKNSWVVSYMEQQFSDGQVNKADLDKISPVSFAKNFVAPVLLVHSVNDTRVPLKQSRDMKNALDGAKKIVKLIELEGDDHKLSNQKTRQQALEAVINFVDANNRN